MYSPAGSSSGPRPARPSASVMPWRRRAVHRCMPASSTTTPTAGTPVAASRTCVVRWLMGRSSRSSLGVSVRSRNLAAAGARSRRAGRSASRASGPSSLSRRRLSSVRISSGERPAARIRKTRPKRCSYSALPAAIAAVTSVAASVIAACSRRDAAASAPAPAGRCADPRVMSERGIEVGGRPPCGGCGGVRSEGIDGVVRTRGDDRVDPRRDRRPHRHDGRGVRGIRGVELVEQHGPNGTRPRDFALVTRPSPAARCRR